MGKNKGAVSVVIAACFWGTAGLFVRSLTALGIATMQLVAVRMTLSVVMLALFILLKDRSAFRIRLKDLWLFAANGIFSITMFNFCYYKTIEFSTLSVAAVLMYTAPFFVLIFSALLFKEKLTVKKVIACIIAFIGCCFVSGVFNRSHSLDIRVITYGLLTGFGYGLYTVFVNLLISRGYKSLTVTFYTFLCAMIGSVSITQLSGTSVVSNLGAKALLVAVGMALINTVLPYIFYTQGLKNLEAGRAPIIATIEPVVATLFGILYSEMPTFQGAVGIVLVLGSVIILQYDVRKRKGDPNETSGKCQN